jgi:imidazolonepropionase-like amidohydrolase
MERTSSKSTPTGSTRTLTPDELRVIVEEAHRLHRKVAAHAATPEGVRNAVDAGVDSVEQGTLADQATLEQMKERGTFLVSMVGLYGAALGDPSKKPEEREHDAKRLADFKKTLGMTRQIGVKIAGGMDATSDALQGRNAMPLETMVRLGEATIEARR